LSILQTTLEWKTLIEIPLFSPFVDKTPKWKRAMKHRSEAGYSSSVGVGDWREDMDIGELLERLIPLAVNNLLVAPHNLKALIHHIRR
jgi:hypothetical protein